MSFFRSNKEIKTDNLDKLKNGVENEKGQSS